MSYSIFQYFNYSKNPKLTMPLCLLFDFSMFPRYYSPFSGPKSPLFKTWSPKSIINLNECLVASHLQNLDINFVVYEIISNIPLKSIDLDKFIELFDSQFNLTKKFDPPLRKQNPIFDGGRQKKFYDNTIYFLT